MTWGECGLRTTGSTEPPRPQDHPRGRGGSRPGLSLALATVRVTGGIRELLDTGPRAVAFLTAHQRVAAEGLGLADDALGQERAWWADALARELITQAATAVTGCREHM